MKNKKAIFLSVILTSILFITIHLNIKVFKGKNNIKNTNIQLKKSIEDKNINGTLSYAKIIDNFRSNGFVIKSFEKNKEEEMIFDIIYKGDSKKFKAILDSLKNNGYKYEILKIDMNFKENKEESFVNFKVYPENN